MNRDEQYFKEFKFVLLNIFNSKLNLNFIILKINRILISLNLTRLANKFK